MAETPKRFTSLSNTQTRIMASIKPLIMRANRLLGANLVEQELVSIDDLDEANERLAELIGGQADSH